MSLRDNKVDFLSTRQQDMKGRRTVNASDAVDLQDYVTLAQLNAVEAEIQAPAPVFVLPVVGTPGTYDSVTTDANGRVVSGTNPTKGYTTQTFPTRAFATVYHNTDANDRLVSVNAFSTANAATLDVYCDTSNPPTTVIEHLQAPANPDSRSAKFIVLPGYYYKVVVANFTLSTWVEWGR